MLLLLGPAVAQVEPKLTLEFVQEGDPQQPRALILIHGGSQSRAKLSQLLQRWGEKSWALRQYCSVYVYEYDASLSTMNLPEEVASDLIARVSSDNFDSEAMASDPVNPVRDVAVNDSRQPPPGLGSADLIVLGFGVGGVVAREFALQASGKRLKVSRVAYAGSPLDGLTVMDLRLAASTPEGASALGTKSVGQLSAGWLYLSELTDSLADWSEAFKGLRRLSNFAAYGRRGAAPRHPTRNVLYGRRAAFPDSLRADTDGLVLRPSATGVATGLGGDSLVAQLAVPDGNHAELQDTQEVYDFLTGELTDKQTIDGYLETRQNIEDYYRFVLEAPVVGSYWDERDDEFHAPQWRESYADALGLYYWMWLAQEPVPEGPSS